MAELVCRRKDGVRVFDLLIRNGRIYDGTGNPWYQADIGVTGNSISHIGGLRDATAGLEIDADGMAVSPGYIDMHTHSDMPLLVDGRAHSHVRQGVTTNVIGNCGTSLGPVSEEYIEHLKGRSKVQSAQVDWTWRSLGEYLELLESRGVSVNVAPLVGQATVRGSVMGFADRPATADELGSMQDMVKSAMQDGAFGMSTGLIYTPGCYAGTEEITELVRTAACWGGIYASHIRGENDTLLDAIKEAIQISRDAGAPLQISHLKAMGRHMWGKSVEALQVVEEARDQGVDVTCDQYPYNASGTGLPAYLPPWTQAGGTEKLKERLKDPSMREKITHDIVNGTEGWVSLHKGVGWENTVIINCSETELEGRTVAEIAEDWGVDPFDAAYEIIIRSEGRTSVVYFTIGDEDLERFMRHEAVMIASDSSALSVEGPLASGRPHPRNFGTYVRVLGHYVRDKNIITLADAIRKMTSLPAQRLGLNDRGLIRPGMRADIVIFDPDTVSDRATYEDPFQYPTGVKHVFVNGVHTIRDEQHTQAKAGDVLRNTHSV